LVRGFAVEFSELYQSLWGLLLPQLHMVEEKLLESGLRLHATNSYGNTSRLGKRHVLPKHDRTEGLLWWIRALQWELAYISHDLIQKGLVNGVNTEFWGCTDSRKCSRISSMTDHWLEFHLQIGKDLNTPRVEMAARSNLLSPPRAVQGVLEGSVPLNYFLNEVIHPLCNVLHYLHSNSSLNEFFHDSWSLCCTFGLLSQGNLKHNSWLMIGVEMWMELRACNLQLQLQRQNHLDYYTSLKGQRSGE
jgi:hypothetical protein